MLPAQITSWLSDSKLKVCSLCYFFSIKSAFSRSSMNLAGHSSRNPTPLMSRRTPHQQVPTVILNDSSPGHSADNSPVISRSRSSSTNKDLRKQVLLSQSGQLRNNASNINLLTNQVRYCANDKELHTTWTNISKSVWCDLVGIYRIKKALYYVVMREQKEYYVVV